MTIQELVFNFHFKNRQIQFFEQRIGGLYYLKDPYKRRRFFMNRIICAVVWMIPITMVWGETASTHILFDKGTNGHFLVRNERDSVIAEVTKKEGNSMDLSLAPGFYSVEMKNPQNFFIANQAIATGQTFSVTAANIALALQASSATQPAPAAVQPTAAESPVAPVQPVVSAPPPAAAAPAPVPAAVQPAAAESPVAPVQPVVSALPPAAAAP
ncbi:MAG: hypothetical protein M0P13_11320, partial [Fibrobacteraceae bacterium]|nr:hypothetical protein [Fibrobacteraceae bacterium]